MTMNNNDLKIEYTRLEDGTRAERQMTELPSRPIPATWRRKIYHPIIITTSKIRRRATPRILQYNWEPRMAMLRSASQCHPRESATFAGHLRRHKCKRCELFPRRTTEKKDHCGWCSQQQGATCVTPQDPYPDRKPENVPRMSPDDRRHRTTSQFRPPTQTTCQSIPIPKTVFRPWHKTRSISTPRTDIKSISIPSLKSSQFRSHTPKPIKLWSQHWNQVNFHPHSKIKSF